MSGVIQGGWEFVIAAYSVTAAVLILYTSTLFIRLHREKGLREADPHVEGGL